MTRYRVTVVIDADNIQNALLRIIYPDGEPVEGIVSIETEEVKRKKHV